MKKMINNPDNIVDEMLNGMVAAHPDYVKRVDGCDVLVRANGSQGKRWKRYVRRSSSRRYVYISDTGSGL